MSRPANQAHSINKALTDAQVKRLLEVAGSATGLTGRRNAALVWLCLSGCRIGEAVSVRYRDLVGSDGQVLTSFVLTGSQTKNSKTREVLLGSKARAALQALVDGLGSDCRDMDLVLPLNSSYAATLVKQLMLRSGLDYRYSSHSLRKSFCTKAVANKVNVRYIQKCMGHSSLAVTTRYVDEFCNGSEKEVLNLW